VTERKGWKQSHACLCAVHIFVYCTCCFVVLLRVRRRAEEYPNAVVWLRDRNEAMVLYGDKKLFLYMQHGMQKSVLRFIRCGRHIMLTPNHKVRGPDRQHPMVLLRYEAASICRPAHPLPPPPIGFLLHILKHAPICRCSPTCSAWRAPTRRR